MAIITSFPSCGFLSLLLVNQISEISVLDLLERNRQAKIYLAEKEFENYTDVDELRKAAVNRTVEAWICTENECNRANNELARRKEVEANLTKINQEIGVLRSEKNTTVSDAAKLEFLLLYRNKLVFLEDNYATGIPADENVFMKQLQSNPDFQNVTKNDITLKKHAKKWIWMLVFGDENKCSQLKQIREALNYNPKKYIWFADQGQRLCDLLSEDNHSELQMFDVKYLTKDKVELYISFLSPDVQKAAKIYFSSEGWIDYNNSGE